MRNFLKICIAFFSTIILFSCSNQEESGDPDVSNVPVTISIQRIDKELFACKTVEEVLNLLLKHKKISEAYFQKPIGEFPALAQELFGLITNKGLQAFYQQAQEPAFFGDNKLETDFKEAFQHLKYYYPDFKEPKIYTVFTGFWGQGTLGNREVMVSDSAIIIGLDYFMGKKAKFLPDVYDYQLQKTYPESVVAQCILLLSQRYNATNPADKTLLAEMIWYGKGYTFGKVMMPSKADSTFLGYTDRQVSESYDNQASIWAHFIDEKLLYTIQDPVKAKYVGDRPSTPEIGPACPGSIGRWLGFRIVSKYYYDDEKLTIQELMKNPDAQKIFEASKYKGLPDEE